MDQFQEHLHQEFWRIKRDLYSLEASFRCGRHITFRAQFYEDVFAWDILGRRLSGFFIEAGAFDGVSMSVTHALEAMGWRGVLVEPIRAKADACRTNRPGSRVVWSALGDTNGEADFVLLDDQYGGAMSYLADSKEHEKMLSVVERTRRTERVPVVTLNEILKDHAGPIDLLSLDVEGSELSALRGIDLERYRPRLILVEEENHAGGAAAAEYMGHTEYQCIGRFGRSGCYLHKSECHNISA